MVCAMPGVSRDSYLLRILRLCQRASQAQYGRVRRRWLPSLFRSRDYFLANSTMFFKAVHCTTRSVGAPYCFTKGI
jgi:hypothetical protein